MSYSFNVDIAVECIKNIVDSNKCVTCDKLEGSRLRFACGHTSCDDCAVRAGGCLLCLTPPASSAPNTHVPDHQLTQRARNAGKLLEAYQEAFNVDVYRRQRISDQLKTEKELFPDCIQAPNKYFNRRKSSIGSFKNKENIRHSSFPGEQISPYKRSKMDKSVYIKQWIEQNENTLDKSPRKPFADLNLNYDRRSPRHSTPIKKRADTILDKVLNDENTRNTTTTKRSHFKTTLSLVKSQSKLTKYLNQDNIRDSSNSKRLKKKCDQHEKSTTKTSNKHDKDESGIVADVETFVIEDSQYEVIDKDKQACLAVLEADKNAASNLAVLEADKNAASNLAVLEADNNAASNSTSPFNLECSEVLKFTDIERTCEAIEFSLQKDSTVINKVPFYKKSLLLDKCKHCVDNNTSKANENEEVCSKDVSITIESSSFITTIKVFNNAHSSPKVINKHSVPVQTDIKGIVELNNEVSLENQTKCSRSLVIEELQNSAKIEENQQSRDLFTDEAKISELKSKLPDKDTELQNITSNEASNVIIDDSDSDGEVNESSIMQVKADVHRSNEELEYGVLVELDQNELEPRTRHTDRSTTPGSTDSSDKENYDPNRPKRMKFSKKDLKKGDREKLNIFELDSILKE